MDETRNFRSMARTFLEEPAASGGVKFFGDYVMEEEVARGAMGIVYRAQQLSLDRTVAVKVMLEGAFAGGQEVERFRQEAGAAAALRHSGIVPVFESGEWEGRLFYAMEWIAGPNLAQHTRDHPPSARQAAQWTREVAEAMHYAHSQGVVHRDLKPANVLIDGEGRARVTDFGMAQRADTASGLTLSGQVLGTPGYMAPEVAGGKARTAGAAADIYGLGALLFHLLTGRAPFIGESHSAILRQLDEAEPVAPRLLNPAVPRDLETVCLKALSREPARRYATAQAMADDLLRFLNGEPVQARPVSSFERAWRWCRRKPALAASLAACVVLLAAGMGGVLWQWRAAELARGEAVKRTDEKEQQRKLAETARQDAERSAEERRVSLYAADTPQVQKALAESDLFQARLLLDAHRPAAGQTDLRGWEWRHFWQMSRGDEIASLYSGRQGLTALAFSPDGTLLAASGGKATVWDSKTMEMKAESPKTALTSLAFSADGRTIYLGGVAPRLLRWRWQEGSALEELGQPPDGLVRVAADPAGKLLAVGRGTRQGGRPDGLVALHDAGSGKVIRELPESGGFASFSPDGTFLATGSWRGSVKLWDPETGELRRSLPGFTQVTGLRFSADGRLLVVSCAAGPCSIVEVESGTIRNGTPGYDASVWESALSPDNTQLATVSLDQSMRLWDAMTGRQTAKFLGHERGVGQVAWSPDGSRVATGGADGMVKLWPVKAKGREDERIQGRVTRRFFSPEGRLVIVQESEKSVALYEYPVLKKLTAADAGTALGFAESGTSVFCAQRSDAPGKPQVVRPWTVPDLQPGETIALAGTETEPHRLNLSDDGRWITGVTAAGRLHAWDLRAGARLIDPGAQIQHAVVAAAVIPEPPRLIAICAAHPYLRLFSLPDCEPQGVMDYPGGPAVSLLPAKDGKTFITSSPDGAVRKWDLQARRELWQFPESSGPIALSRDGRTLACAAHDVPRVRLWNLATRREVGRFSMPRMVSSLAFGPDDGALLITESGGSQRDTTLVLSAPGFAETDGQKPAQAE